MNVWRANISKAEGGLLVKAENIPSGSKFHYFGRSRDKLEQEDIRALHRHPRVASEMLDRVEFSHSWRPTMDRPSAEPPKIPENAELAVSIVITAAEDNYEP